PPPHQPQLPPLPEQKADIIHTPPKAGQQDMQKLAHETHAVAVDAQQIREVAEERARVQDLVDDVGDGGVGGGGEGRPDAG
ncbi:hypothetical protein V498_10315, partial [Pseudogymnoascus sp. VKM F-4517 (FW-2822)]